MKTPTELKALREKWEKEYFQNVSQVWQEWFEGSITMKERDETLTWFRRKLWALRNITRDTRMPVKQGTGPIVVWFRDPNGWSTNRLFGSFEKARDYAQEKLGPMPNVEEDYAINPHGLITVKGCGIRDIFPLAGFKV